LKALILGKKVNTNNEPTFANEHKNKPIYSITPFSLLDYPDKTACIVWFAGCNMRCKYCYNPDIVLGKGKSSFQDVLDFLYKRKSLLDGVVLSGGECTLHKGIIDFCKAIKALGFSIKLDTNGSRPTIIAQLLKYQLIDYIALDFKAPIHRFQFITKTKLFHSFLQSLEVIMAAKVPFEVRTTVHSDLLSVDDLNEMVDILEQKGYRGKFFLQHFVNDTPNLSSLDASDYRIVRNDYNTDNIEVVVRN
jgi:pyruvate formate lyase activating enzyme